MIDELILLVHASFYATIYFIAGLVFTVRYVYFGKRSKYLLHTIKDRVADSGHTLGVFSLL